MTRLDPYSASLREEQKAVLNGLLGLIYDNYDTTRRIESTVNSIYRITVALLVIVTLVVIGIILFICVIGYKKYQNESSAATQHMPLRSFRQQQQQEQQRRPESSTITVTEKLIEHHQIGGEMSSQPTSASLS